MFIRYLLLTLVLLNLIYFAACSQKDPEEPTPSGPVTIAFNEINATGNPDWIELYNYGDEDVDIQGFVVYDRVDAKYTLPQGHIIKPGDFLILICDDQGTGLNMPFRLTSEGEVVTIEDGNENVLDRVTFPALGDGLTYARFPDGTGAWQITGFETKNKTNGSGPVTYFRSYSYSPEIPMANDDIVFSIQVSDNANVGSILFMYSFEGASFNTIAMSATSGGQYTATLPAVSDEGDLRYYFKLTDNGGAESFLPADAPENPFDMTLTTGDVPDLVINEFMASNSSTFADPFGEYDDWIEIYNAGNTAVDMGRFYFSDSEDPFDDRIPGNAPEKTTIQPGGYLIFWADGETEQGPNHLKFRLSATGESISLYHKDGRLIDSRKFGIQSTDVSEGRSPNGSTTWVKFNNPTPGAANP